MKILYLGASAEASTSRHRADALRRLGHQVTIADPYTVFNKQVSSKVIGAIHFRTGYRFLQNSVLTWSQHQLKTHGKSDIVWIDSGELFGPKAIQMLSESGQTIIPYNHDDPTGDRDRNRFNSLIQAIPYYNLCTAVREINIPEFYKAGAQHVIKIWRSYDEIVHAPHENVSTINQEYLSDICFIGTWMRHEARDKFLLYLIESGLNVRIWGHRWEKSPYWSKLKKNIAGGPLSGRSYVSAIQGAKICLGMLSKGNRDLHTTRTMEIPYAGGVLCAERTSEHQELYKEGVEAVFWSDADECVEQCKQLLQNDMWRESIRHAGMARIRSLKLGHEDICRSIIETAIELRTKNG